MGGGRVLLLLSLSIPRSALAALRLPGAALAPSRLRAALVAASASHGSPGGLLPPRSPRLGSAGAQRRGGSRGKDPAARRLRAAGEAAPAAAMSRDCCPGAASPCPPEQRLVRVLCACECVRVCAGVRAARGGGSVRAGGGWARAVRWERAPVCRGILSPHVCGGPRRGRAQPGGCCMRRSPRGSAAPGSPSLRSLRSPRGERRSAAERSPGRRGRDGAGLAAEPPGASPRAAGARRACECGRGWEHGGGGPYVGVFISFNHSRGFVFIAVIIAGAVLNTARGGGVGGARGGWGCTRRGDSGFLLEPVCHRSPRSRPPPGAPASGTGRSAALSPSFPGERSHRARAARRSRRRCGRDGGGGRMYAAGLGKRVCGWICCGLDFAKVPGRGGLGAFRVLPGCVGTAEGMLLLLRGCSAAPCPLPAGMCAPCQRSWLCREPEGDGVPTAEGSRHQPSRMRQKIAVAPAVPGGLAAPPPAPRRARSLPAGLRPGAPR